MTIITTLQHRITLSIARSWADKLNLELCPRHTLENLAQMEKSVLKLKATLEEENRLVVLWGNKTQEVNERNQTQENLAQDEKSISRLRNEIKGLHYEIIGIRLNEKRLEGKLKGAAFREKLLIEKLIQAQANLKRVKREMV